MNMSECMTSSFRGLYTRRLLGALRKIRGLSKQKEDLTLVKRVRRIRIAADLSLALTSNRTAWGRALVTKYISQLKTDRCLVKGIMGKKRFNDVMRMHRHADNSTNRLLFMGHEGPLGLAGRMKKNMKASLPISRFIIRRSIHRKNAVNIPVRASAYKLVLNDRTRQLQRLIPGGESMNSSCLLREAADYIVSLRAQVQVMHCLAYHSTQALS